MRSFLRARILGGAALVALTALLAGTDPVVAVAPPDRKADKLKIWGPALTKHIDAVIEQRAGAEKIALSPRSDDAEFLRRAYLDITGRIPTGDKAAAFLASTDPERRRKLIDELLASKDYGKHQADIWQALMVGAANSDNVRFRQFYGNLGRWLEESFNANKPWDDMVREIVTAQGPVDRPSPAVYFLANGPSVDKITDNVTKLFLGVQLQCAQCHNHPFTDWKQNEYWGMAAFFMKVRTNGNPRMAAKQGNTISINEGPGIVRNRRLVPTSAKFLPPKFLQGEQPKLARTDPYRPILANWLTKADNAFFSKAMVNRTWSQFFGRGFVNPIDDMHEGNNPSHPELLAHLSREFAASGFDLKHLIRAICNSEAYQRTSKPVGNNGDAAPELLARMNVKPLTPGQLYDSLTQVLGAPGQEKRQRRMGGMRFAGGNARQVFVNSFQIEEGSDALEYQAGIPQVLRLMNAPPFNRAAALGPIMKGSQGWKAATEKLYLATLSRRPTEAELNRIGAHIRKSDRPRDALADVLWALVNCSEFALNH